MITVGDDRSIGGGGGEERGRGSDLPHLVSLSWIDSLAAQPASELIGGMMVTAFLRF